MKVFTLHKHQNFKIKKILNQQLQLVNLTKDNKGMLFHFQSKFFSKYNDSKIVSERTIAELLDLKNFTPNGNLDYSRRQSHSLKYNTIRYFFTYFTGLSALLFLTTQYYWSFLICGSLSIFSYLKTHDILNKSLSDIESKYSDSKSKQFNNAIK